MESLLQKAADMITAKAGWPTVSADNDGRCRFSLDGGLDFELFSPDGRTGIFLSEISAAPDISSPRAAEEMERIAALSAGVLKKRLSVLSISESNAFELSRSFPLAQSSEQEIIDHAKDFLNDLAWWKRQLAGDKPQTAPASDSPFSFFMGSWFPG